MSGYKFFEYEIDRIGNKVVGLVQTNDNAQTFSILPRDLFDFELHVGQRIVIEMKDGYTVIRKVIPLKLDEEQGRLLQTILDSFI